MQRNRIIIYTIWVGSERSRPPGIKDYVGGDCVEGGGVGDGKGDVRGR